jgi:hypothetical protein
MNTTIYDWFLKKERWYNLQQVVKPQTKVNEIILLKLQVDIGF